MPNIALYNQIAQVGLDQLDSQYKLTQDKPDAILVRSANLFDLHYNANLKAIARAGAGTNNIDIKTCTEKGIAVFNTPGANANAVKELVFAGLLVASRKIIQGIQWAKEHADQEDFIQKMEAQKKAYKGYELNHQSLGVIGCGAIGIPVANLALRFGMNVHAYDPYMSVQSAWNLSRYVSHETNLEDLYKKVDFLTLHLPQNESTKHLINAQAIQKMKPGIKIINLARGGLVDEQAILDGLNSGQIACYVTDFPSAKLAQHDKVIAIPHLGASTYESEENCAIQAVNQLKDYLEHGNIQNSVNLPNATMEPSEHPRVCILHKNVPKMIAKITNCFEKDNNIEDMVNKSRQELAYTMLDLTLIPEPESIDKLVQLEGVIHVTVHHA